VPPNELFGLGRILHIYVVFFLLAHILYSSCSVVCACDVGLMCTGAASVIRHWLPDPCCLSSQTTQCFWPTQRSPAWNCQSHGSVTSH